MDLNFVHALQPDAAQRAGERAEQGKKDPIQGREGGDNS